MAFPSSSSVALRQPQHKMPNDVALDFRRACFDGVAAGTQIAVGPHAAIDRVRAVAFELSVGAEQLLRDLLEALVELAPEYFLDGAFRPRNTRRADAAEGAHLVHAHDLDFRVALGQLLAHERVLGGRL